MEKLYNKRRSQHFLLLLRYWRLVFNDHFIIALFVLLGALIWGYSQALGQLKPTIWWAKPITILILLVLLQMGRLATLIEPADPVFLLPQSKAIDHYLRQAKWYSLILAELSVIICTIVVIPFLLAATRTTELQVILVIMTVGLLKAAWLDASLNDLYEKKGQSKLNKGLSKWLAPFVVLTITLMLSAAAGFILAVLWLIWEKYQLTKVKKQLLDWRLAVATESQRMLGVYRFFNLFTDVPAVQGTIHRRKYLDFIIRFLSRDKTVFSYLYARGLIRGTEISGLVVRLTLIGMVILFFVTEFWLNLILYLLFIYLITVQLVPFYWQYDNHVFTHLYPIKPAEKRHNFQKLMGKTIAIATGLLWLASSIGQLSIGAAAIKVVLGGLAVWLLCGRYTTSRITNKTI